MKLRHRQKCTHVRYQHTGRLLVKSALFQQCTFADSLDGNLKSNLRKLAREPR